MRGPGVGGLRWLALALLRRGREARLTSSASWRVSIGVMPGEYVRPEVAARPAQHGVRVIAVACRIVVLDQQIVALDPAAVPRASRQRAFPGEAHLPRTDPLRRDVAKLESQ